MKSHINEKITATAYAPEANRLHHLAQAIFPASYVRRAMLMMVGHMDESGHSKDPNCQFVSLAGLVAPVDDWKPFSEKWQAALDEFINGAPFHMKDFVMQPGIGVYEGWNESKRRAFFGKLVTAIVESKAEPMSCTVSLRDYAQLRAEHQAMVKDPYYMAFQKITKFMTSAALHYDDPIEKVAMVYAYQEEFGATEAGRAQQLWHTIKKNFGFGLMMGSYASATPQELLPLQAADLFAYEITHEFEGWNKLPERKMRWGLKQILRSLPDDRPMVKLYTFPVIVDMLSNSGAFKFEAEHAWKFAYASHENLIEVRSLLMQRARSND